MSGGNRTTGVPVSHASEWDASQTGGLGLVLPPEALELLAHRVATILEERAECRAAVTQVAEPQSDYLSVPEAAERLRAKPQRVYDLLSARRLSRFKDGSRVLISRHELDEYLAGSRR